MVEKVRVKISAPEKAPNDRLADEPEVEFACSRKISLCTQSATSSTVVSEQNETVSSGVSTV